MINFNLLILFQHLANSIFQLGPYLQACRSLIVLAAERGTKWEPEKRTFENGLKRANSVKKRMRMKIFSLATLCTLSKKTMKSKMHEST